MTEETEVSGGAVRVPVPDGSYTKLRIELNAGGVMAVILPLPMTPAQAGEAISVLNELRLEVLESWAGPSVRLYVQAYDPPERPMEELSEAEIDAMVAGTSGYIVCERRLEVGCLLRLPELGVHVVVATTHYGKVVEAARVKDDPVAHSLGYSLGSGRCAECEQARPLYTAGEMVEGLCEGCLSQ